MSSSFHKAAASRLLACALPALLAGASWVFAAETYIRPSLEASVERHTNRALDPDAQDPPELTGFGIAADLTFGILTPASETLLRPGVALQRFDQNENLDSTEQFLDFRTRYRSPRDEFQLVGKYSRRDTFTAFLEPGFDDFDPEDPTIDDASRIDVDNVITRAQLRPSFSHLHTERLGFGVDATVEAIRFREEDPGNRVDYDYGRLGASLLRVLTQRTELRAGPYVSRYEARDDSYRADAYGLAVRVDHALSEVFDVNFSGGVENDRIERTFPVNQRESHNSWSALLGMNYKAPLSETRVSVGRVLSPSTRGTKVTADQVNAQYDRALTPRANFTAAGRFVRDEQVGVAVSGRNREYATAAISLRWMVTPRWFVQGGYEYRWQEHELDPDAASDNSVFAGVGYIGLGPQTQR